MNLARAGALLATSLLAGCIPLWFPQYRLAASDGSVATPHEDTSAYTELKVRSDDDAQVDVAIDADRGSQGMLLLFHAHVPAGSNPRIETASLQLGDCAPDKSGPLPIKDIQSDAGHDGKVFFQWWVFVPDSPRHCSFTLPTLLYADKRWTSPTFTADRGTSPVTMLNLTTLPAH